MTESGYTRRDGPGHNLRRRHSVSLATEAFRKDAVAFLHKIFRRGGGAALDFIKDEIADWRRDNALVVLDLADKKLGNVSTEPAEVHPKILLPLLDAASLEEDFALRELWANLLANAADSRAEVKVQPAFVAILRELTALQARFLERLYDGQMAGCAGYVSPLEFDMNLLRRHYWSANSVEVNKEQPMPAIREADVAIDVLKRQQLLNQATETILPGGPSGPPGPVVRPTFSLTDLGYAFISAVRSPSARSVVDYHEPVSGAPC